MIQHMNIQNSFEQKIAQKLNPISFCVINESHMHSVPKNSETHFRIEIVSDFFNGKNLLSRHRLLNELFAEEISKIRACSYHAFTQAEWEERFGQTEPSPHCQGGSRTQNQDKK